MNKEELISYLTKVKEPIDVENKWQVELKSTKSRSLNANAYYWVLVNKISNALNKDSKEVHLEMLISYGQIAYDNHDRPLVFSINSNLDVKQFLKNQYCQHIGVGQVGGVVFNHYRILKGSSELDSMEMSILINGTIQEAKNLGIETLTQDEISKMLMHMLEQEEKSD